MIATPAEISSPAARLCTACGLCCNGVMFHTVKLQPTDSAPALVALGLKLKRKKRHDYLLQPCPAFRGSCCAIYTARPERCRRFECRQLLRLASDETTEAHALARIREVQRRVEELNELLREAGATNPKRPLSKRCEKALAEPLDATAAAPAVALRTRIITAQQELETMLDEYFRLPRETAEADRTVS